MRMGVPFNEQLLSGFRVSARRVTGQAFRRVFQLWIQAFFTHVKDRTDHWIYNGFYWHAYSFGFERAVTGDDAFFEYRAKPLKRYWIFCEADDSLFEFDSLDWPDLRALNTDLYVFPSTMEWMFVTTHEMSIDLGPYFAVSPSSSNSFKP